MATPQWTLSPWAMDQFERELAVQCRFGIEASHEMTAAFRARDRFTYFRRAQAFLSAVANVSKLLWPGERGNATRGTDLCARVGVPSEGSPLQSKKVRNAYDHFDEHLDKRTKAVGVMVDFVFGAGEGPTLGIGASSEPTAFLRNFDAPSQTLRFADFDLEVPAVVAELQRIEAEVRSHGVALLHDVEEFPPCATCGSKDHYVVSRQLSWPTAPANQWTCLVDGLVREILP